MKNKAMLAVGAILLAVGIIVVFVAAAGTVEKVSTAYAKAYYTLNIKQMEKLSTGAEKEKIENLKKSLEGIPSEQKKIDASIIEQKIKVVQKQGKQAKVEADNVIGFKERKMHYHVEMQLQKGLLSWRVSQFDEKYIKIIKE